MVLPQRRIKSYEGNGKLLSFTPSAFPISTLPFEVFGPFGARSQPVREKVLLNDRVNGVALTNPPNRRLFLIAIHYQHSISDQHPTRANDPLAVTRKIKSSNQTVAEIGDLSWLASVNRLTPNVRDIVESGSIQN